MMCAPLCWHVSAHVHMYAAPADSTAQTVMALIDPSFSAKISTFTEQTLFLWIS